MKLKPKEEPIIITGPALDPDHYREMVEWAGREADGLEWFIKRMTSEIDGERLTVVPEDHLLELAKQLRRLGVAVEEEKVDKVP